MTFDKRLVLLAITVMMTFWLSWSSAQEAVDWSQTPDFGALRLEVGDRTDFYETCESTGRRDASERITSYLEAEDWEAAARDTETRLQICPVDIAMHVMASVALENLDRAPEAQHHIDWYTGLIDSILESGDGRSPETAFVTISVMEEYIVLQAFGLMPKSQSLVGDRDLFIVTNSAGEETEIYFYPELHWKRMQRMFAE